MAKLGNEVREVVTGFKGRVTGIVDYITGCRQALVIPPVGADGKIIEGMWFDVDRLEIIDAKPLRLPASTANGFDMEPPKR